MVTVHHFKVFNIVTGEYEVLPMKRTAEAISKIRTAEIIEGTAEDVPESALDSQGRYNPHA